MKTWKQKADISPFGVCTVKELNDKEGTRQMLPISCGFVQLYQNNKRVGSCGSNYAKERIIKK